MRLVICSLTLHDPIPGKEKKLTQIFIFTLLFGASKAFMKIFKAFIKPFQAPQRSVNKKLSYFFLFVWEVLATLAFLHSVLTLTLLDLMQLKQWLKDIYEKYIHILDSAFFLLFNLSLTEGIKKHFLCYVYFKIGQRYEHFFFTHKIWKG